MKSINWDNVKSADATGREFATRSNGLQALQYVAREPYAWPGGYETFVITTDGGLICQACVRAEYRQMYHDTANKGWNCGWTVAAADATCNCDEATCDNCGRDLIAAD
jgi:hypothetical protein